MAPIRTTGAYSPVGRRSAPTGERGIALILVLWLTLVLSISAVSVTRIARSDVRIAFNVQQAAEAEALADGGVYLAVAALMKGEGADPWPLDGTAREMVIAGELVRVSVHDEGLKLDLNGATAEMLETALLSSGMDAQAASAIADDIVSERQARDRAALTGERRSALRRSGQFATIRELQAVANLGNGEYILLRDYFTVYVTQRASSSAARAVARRRASANSDSVDGTRRRSGSKTYAIKSNVRLASGAGFERYAIVRLSTRTPDGHQVLHWD